MNQFITALQKLITIIVYGSEEEKLKKMELKKIKQELTTSYSHYINMDEMTVYPAISEDIHNIQTNVNQMNTVFEQLLENNRRKLGQILLEQWDEENAAEWQWFKNSENINQYLSDAKDMGAAKTELEERINKLELNYSSHEYMNFNKTYTSLSSMLDLTNFEFTHITDLFDTISPQNVVRVAEVQEQLLDFYYLAFSVTWNSDLEKCLNIMIANLEEDEQKKEAISAIKMIRKILKDKLSENFFTLLFKHINTDNTYIAKIKTETIFFLEDHVEKEIRYIHSRTLEQFEESRDSYIDTLFEKICPNEVLPSISGYTEPLKKLLYQNGMKGFYYIKTLKMIRVFYHKVWVEKANKTLNKLITNADFSTNMLKSNVSSSYYRTIEIIAPIDGFETYMKNINNKGSAKNLRNMLKMKEKGMTEGHTVEKIVRAVDNKAREIVASSHKELKQISEYMNLCIKDYKNGTKHIVNNIHEIDRDKNKYFMIKLANDTKEIMQFIEILNVYLQIEGRQV